MCLAHIYKNLMSHYLYVDVSTAAAVVAFAVRVVAGVDAVLVVVWAVLVIAVVSAAVSLGAVSRFVVVALGVAVAVMFCVAIPVVDAKVAM